MRPLRLKTFCVVVAAIVCVSLWTRSILAEEGIPQVPADFKDKVLGAFRLHKDGVGFMILEGCLMAEVLTVRAGNVVPGLFVVDMGTDALCVLDSAFAHKIGLGEEKTISLKFGHKETFESIPVTVEKRTDLNKCSKRNAQVLQGKTLSGVIGSGLFQGRTIVIDYAEYRLRIAAPTPEDEDESAHVSGEEKNASPSPWEVAYAMTPAPFCCAVRVNDAGPFAFQLNTACARSWVKKSVASSAAWRRGKKPGSFLLAGLDMTALSVDFEFRRNAKGETPPVMDGVLGNDFLSRFVVTIDTAAGRVLFTPVK